MALATNLGTPKQNLRLPALLDQHLTALEIRGYSPYTVRSRRVHIGFFLRWCAEGGIHSVMQITSAILQDYQRYNFECRKRDGQPLAVASRFARLVPLRGWFRWMGRQRLISDTLANEIELPRLGRPLPRNVLSAQEIERVLSQPQIDSAFGLRDRAILELLYSTGLRRLEVVRLRLFHIQLDRKLLFVREGKGGRDRYVPLGRRAADWLQRYIRQARPQLVQGSAEGVLFLSRPGQPLSRDHLTWIARRYISAAKLGKTGACHLFRHSMATLMHENGADIRCIQQILGHADIRTTQIYTHVALRTLQSVHARTHPAAA